MILGLWVCAPINRAVDDKAAKSLLGESFKRQLKYDGVSQLAGHLTFFILLTINLPITFQQLNFKIYRVVFAFNTRIYDAQMLTDQ